MNQNLYKKIAVLDIDGTLIAGQIQQGLINYFYAKGKLSTMYVIRLNLWFVMYKLHITNNIKGIFEFGLKYLKDKSVHEIDSIVSRYVEEKVKQKVFHGSFGLIKKLREEGYVIILLSTAVDVVVSKIAELFQVDDYICTKLERVHDCYTGRISGDIAYGERKINLLKDYLSSRSYSLADVRAYADHESDIPLLKIVGKAYIANPDIKMERLSKMLNIDTINLQKQ